MPEKPHFCAVGKMPPSWCEMKILWIDIFMCVCSCSGKSILNSHDFSKWTQPVKNSSLVSILWRHLFTCCFKSHVFPSTSRRAKNRSKFPPANPWAHGRGQVRCESLCFFLNSFQRLSSMPSLKHERRSKVSQMPNFTFTNISFLWCFFIFAVWQPRSITTVWNAVLCGFISLIECLFLSLSVFQMHETVENETTDVLDAAIHDFIIFLGLCKCKILMLFRWKLQSDLKHF